MSDHTPRVGNRVRRLPQHCGTELFRTKSIFTICEVRKRSNGFYYFRLREDPAGSRYYSEYFTLLRDSRKGSGFKQFQQKIK